MLFRSVGFTSKQVTYNGKTFPENTIHEVSVVGGASAQPQDGGWGAPAPTAPKAGAPSSFDANVIASQLRSIANDLNGYADDITNLASGAEF